MLILFDSRNKINTIYLTFAKKLLFLIQLIDIVVLNIDGSMLKIYEIVVVVFLIIDLVEQVRFFKSTF